MEIKLILRKRQDTHGDFSDNARISEELMRVLSSGPSFERLTDTQLNALRMIMLKASRIVSGNPNEKDSWADIAGYATLATERIQIEHPELPLGSPEIEDNWACKPHIKYMDPFDGESGE